MHEGGVSIWASAVQGQGSCLSHVSLPHMFLQRSTHMLFSSVVTMLPTSQHAFVVTLNEFHATVTSMCWTPDSLIIDVQEYLGLPDTRRPRLIEDEFVLGARVGSVVEAYLTDRSHGRLPRFLWFPSKPADRLVHRMSYTAQWLSGALDM